MKSNHCFRGPSAIERAASMEEETPSRAVANQKIDEERHVRAVAEEEERNMQDMEEERNVSDPEKEERAMSMDEERTAQAMEDDRNARYVGLSQPAVRTSYSGDKPSGEMVKPEARKATNLYKTICDWDVHKDDKPYMFNGSSKWLRVVGTGKPKVIGLKPSIIKKLGTCEKEVYDAHENVHVQNATQPCADFKKCVEGYYGWTSSTVYYHQFATCHNKHKGGLHPNCKQDETQAYTASANKATALAGQKRCASEKSRLESLATQHKKWAVKPPNCKP